jgi:hypothetical protein
MVAEFKPINGGNLDYQNFREQREGLYERKINETIQAVRTKISETYTEA